ncbi:hypothetical protein AVEN_29242-1 [Araneus ventricosus]|uniref:Uncharacterized protein n=1 Tax=Araneus ventricosus TaxID=182803 RepID=A0A4Y2E0G9_ARAVE|nr:hypothetical protein AVEN_29242-1 [Araneus ventricosus]
MRTQNEGGCESSPSSEGIVKGFAETPEDSVCDNCMCSPSHEDKNELPYCASNYLKLPSPPVSYMLRFGIVGLFQPGRSRSLMAESKGLKIETLLHPKFAAYTDA